MVIILDGFSIIMLVFMSFFAVNVVKDCLKYNRNPRFKIWDKFTFSLVSMLIVLIVVFVCSVVVVVALKSL